MRRLWAIAIIFMAAALWAQQGAESKPEKQAAEHQESHPTLVGCLKQNDHQFTLEERKTGTRYRLAGPADELKDHVNHLVELIGRPAKAEGAAKAVAGANGPAFEVDAMQDLAPTCGAGQQH